MGNFSSKDSHGPTGAHVDSFHTPPSSPQNDLPAVPQLFPPTSPQPSSAAPISSPPPVPVLTSSGKKSQPSTTPTSPVPPPDWRPHSPVSSNSSTIGPGVSPVHDKPGSTVAVKGQVALGRNGGPPTSTPRTPVAQGKCVAVSPTKSPSSPSSSLPIVRSSSKQNWRERDSGLSQSLLPGQEAGDSQDEEVEKLLEECRTTLGITASQDGATNTAEILKCLLTEVKSLKSTLQTERGEWLQFQADLQVAVSVADRLRAEAEEELTALRTAQKDVERELAAAQQRQKEADMQLVTLRGELTESRQRLATLTQTQGKTDIQAPCQELEKLNGEPNNSKEGNQRGREREVYRLGREALQSGSQNEGMKNVVSEEARTDCKGVTKRCLRNVTNEDRSAEEVRSSETRRTVTTERSSLSRLPASSDPPTLQNGTSQSNTATTAGSTNKNVGQVRGRRSLDWQDSRPNTDTGKREESLNKYNSALTELPPTKSQDGFNLLLRRHGGSKRNSLLRWCQSRTQGYKNIDITNFSSSWADGLAFCAVYHTYLPSHIPYSTLSLENKRENLSLAFKTGETVGIAQSLTVVEMLRAGGPDWQRVLSYVESMYRHFEM
ncbi:cytospin-A isoform X2 [Thunnus albacares]|uniref:cytospin-A isoform X2 n=1 Tax=Thunnus maccoyii TaxID=8240 RepID=UPI001C4D1FAA|nr:cytospin-A isoform X2 [Thunnus maccoyii]XP_044231583.1 cytospin-A isoform X2 [Thunnus albacares]